MVLAGRVVHASLYRYTLAAGAAGVPAGMAADEPAPLVASGDVQLIDQCSADHGLDLLGREPRRGDGVPADHDRAGRWRRLLDRNRCQRTDPGRRDALVERVHEPARPGRFPLRGMGAQGAPPPTGHHAVIGWGADCRRGPNGAEIRRPISAPFGTHLQMNTKTATRTAAVFPVIRGFYWERKTGFEPATFSLARRCSTTEPLPRRGCSSAEWILGFQ